MSFVITKAGMWHTKGPGIATDEVEGGRGSNRSGRDATLGHGVAGEAHHRP